MPRLSRLLPFSLCILAACAGDGREDQAGPTGATTTDPGDGDGDGDGDDDKFDVGDADIPDGDGGGSCKVWGDSDGVGDCDQVAPPDSFEPATQWEWWPEDEIFSVITPLVANLTDDNNDGEIDLCDVPDVVVVTTAKLVNPPDPAHLWILDGETGQVHARFDTPVKQNGTPAIADLDDDGVPEIITAAFDHDGTPAHLIAFEPDGTIKWEGDTYPGPWHGATLAIADVDHDGDPEIAAHDMLFDHEGNMLWQANVQLIVGDVPAIADLDGEGDMEIVYGNRALRSDGSTYWSTNLQPGFPAIADLDGDARPEVLFTNEQGINLIEHDGAIKYSGLTPTGVEPAGLNWARPATVHNFDDDPEPEFAMSSREFYSVYEADGTIKWSATVLDASGYAAGTAFDFLGDAEAEAMYADESAFFIFNGQGEVLLTTPRESKTLHEYPVVADIDNDGSAEIIVVSEERSAPGKGGPTMPTVHAIRDVEDRWIQARRIWNQHTYHVTNVREDATIPQFEKPHWTELNTFRTNAQLSSSGDVCKPKPQG